MCDVQQLAKASRLAVAKLRMAEETAKRAHEALEEAERAKRNKEQQEEYAREARFAVESTSLPEWLVKWITYKAHIDGHSAGQSEVDMLTFSMIHEAERYRSEYAAQPTT